MSETPWKVIDLQAVRTPNKPGLLAIAEFSKRAPRGFFPNDAAPRVYWIVNDDSEWSLRGGHYHPEGGKRELIVALSGQIQFNLHSKSACDELTLRDPAQGLLIPNGVWHGVRLSPGAVLLSIASTLYAPDESVIAKPCDCR